MLAIFALRFKFSEKENEIRGAKIYQNNVKHFAFIFCQTKLEELVSWCRVLFHEIVYCVFLNRILTKTTFAVKFEIK